MLPCSGTGRSGAQCRDFKENREWISDEQRRMKPKILSALPRITSMCFLHGGMVTGKRETQIPDCVIRRFNVGILYKTAEGEENTRTEARKGKCGRAFRNVQGETHPAPPSC